MCCICSFDLKTSGFFHCRKLTQITTTQLCVAERTFWEMDKELVKKSLCVRVLLPWNWREQNASRTSISLKRMPYTHFFSFSAISSTCLYAKKFSLLTNYIDMQFFANVFLKIHLHFPVI